MCYMWQWAWTLFLEILIRWLWYALEQWFLTSASWPSSGLWGICNWAAKRVVSVHIGTYPHAWAVDKHVHVNSIWVNGLHVCTPLVQMELHACVLARHLCRSIFFPKLSMVYQARKIGELYLGFTSLLLFYPYIRITLYYISSWVISCKN